MQEDTRMNIFLLVLESLAVSFPNNVLSLQCHSCNNMKQTQQLTCPGAELMDFQDTDACRLMSLSDGTVINQSPVAKELCTPTALKNTELRIAKDFGDGKGVVACCMWNGCNANAIKAKYPTLDEYKAYLKNITDQESRIANPPVNNFGSPAEVSTHKMGQEFLFPNSDLIAGAKGMKSRLPPREELASEDNKFSKNSIWKKKSEFLSGSFESQENGQSSEEFNSMGSSFNSRENSYSSEEDYNGFSGRSGSYSNYQGGELLLPQSSPARNSRSCTLIFSPSLLTLPSLLVLSRNNK